MKTENQNIQVLLIEEIKQHIPAHKSLVDLFMDVLSISSGGAYRRIRNETPLSIEETVKLCQYFHLSFDKYIKTNAKQVLFGYKPLYGGGAQQDFEAYLQLILAMLKETATKNGQIFYAAQDIPIIRSVGYVKLAQFKIYYWLNSVLSNQGNAAPQFEFGMLPSQLNTLCQEIKKYQTSVKSEEIWTEETLYSTLKQLEFFWNTGRIKSREIALEILQDIKTLLLDLRSAAEKENNYGIENVEPNFKLYLCEVLIGNNTILLDNGTKKRVFLSYNSMNSLNTTDSSFFQECEQWLNKLRKKSVLLSGAGEKQRSQFFYRLNQRIEESYKLLQKEPFSS